MLRKELMKDSVCKVYLGYLNDAIEYISNADDARLKILLTSHPKLIDVIFPDDNNLLGVAILKKASIQIIKTLIGSGVSVEGIDGFSLPPLQAVPIINPNIEQLHAAYELVRAGANYDFYASNSILWLDDCKDNSPILYEKICQAILDRAKDLGRFEEPQRLDLLSKKHQCAFLEAIVAADHTRLQLLILKQKILTAKEIAEDALQNCDFCSIQMHVYNDSKIINFSINKTDSVSIDKNLNDFFTQSNKKLKNAKKTFKTTLDNLEKIEAKNTLILYYNNGWANARLDSDLLKTIAHLDKEGMNYINR
jgi:hypothetical protein